MLKLQFTTYPPTSFSSWYLPQAWQRYSRPGDYSWYERIDAPYTYGDPVTIVDGRDLPKEL